MDNATHIVTSFEVVDHGIEHSQYFQGCGTSFTSYNHVATGIGSNFAEAYEDATEMMSQGEENINFDGFDARVLEEIGRKALPKRPQVTSKHSDEHYYHVSIRYNLALDTTTIADDEQTAEPFDGAAGDGSLTR